MAGTKFSYVRNFELPDPLIPSTFMVVRIDGHAFHRLSQEHKFKKPNDERALKLMDHAARDVMSEFKDIMLAFGESDEYSFLFRKNSALYNRREAKILTTITSLFTSSYVFNWSMYISDTPLQYCPYFDGRIVLYPSATIVRDYFSWRQADTHINNLYNTIFWALVLKGGQSTTEAHDTLKGTVSSQKHDMLFSRFGINYNELPARFRKGSVLVREEVPAEVKGVECEATISPVSEHTSEVVSPGAPKKPIKKKTSTTIELYHCDIISDEFWTTRPNIIIE